METRRTSRPVIPYCALCKGSGVRNTGDRNHPRWENCTCGRKASSTGEGKKAKQWVREKRLEEIKTKGW